MSISLNVIVIGAGGHLGRHIVAALDGDPRFALSVLSRRSSRSTFPQHIPVHRVGDSYPNDELMAAFTGQHAVISAIATAAIPQQRLFIDASVQAGVKHFVPSEFGHDTRNEQLWEILPQVCRSKAEVVACLKSKETEGLRWTSIINGPLIDLALENYLGYNVKEERATMLDDGLVAWPSTTLRTVALAVKNVLLRPDETSNRYLFVSSVTASQMEYLASFQKMTGSQWKVACVRAQDEKDAALERLSKGDFSGIPRLLRYVTCVKGFGGNYLDYEDSANQLLSLPQESVDGIVRRLVRN